MTQVLIEPGDVDADRTLRKAALATRAEFAEAGVHQLAGSSLPGAADPAGISFAAEGVSVDGFEVGTYVQTCAAADAVKRLVEYGIFAHGGASVIDQYKMELARPGALARCGERRRGERRPQDADIGSKRLSGCAGGKQLDEGLEIGA